MRDGDPALTQLRLCLPNSLKNTLKDLMVSRMPVRLAMTVVAASLALAACGSDTSNDTASTDEPLTIYVGRDEELVKPFIEQFEQSSGVEVEARYADTPELAATLLEEGDKTPAHVFLSQDAGALGALSDAGLLRELPSDITDAVLPGFTSTDDTWVGVTGRARVIAYDSEKLKADEVPGTVASFTEPEWKGRVGFPPGNASFQSFITGMRVAEGEDAAAAWLKGIKGNDFQPYEKNGLVLDAVNDGSLDVGLINHYYWYQKAAEVGADKMRAQLKFADAGDPGTLVNVTGAGILTEHPDAEEFLEFLVSETGQTYFVDKTFEYPLVEGLPVPEGLPALADLQGPEIDLGDLADLETTVKMIDEAGLS